MENDLAVYDDIYGIGSFGTHFGAALKYGVKLSDEISTTHLSIVLTYSTLGTQLLEGNFQVISIPFKLFYMNILIFFL